ncbi:hypothetical protein [Nonomuraea roseoviolacea]|uniref:Sensor domain-containing protein n=1 Tax=Nonomuraea roseoviolacea subsp. carminata TaxID=160689 RepID=A0ABT1K0R7_9ACTN|nr:hypothetical protein [Nonomuraea roseoviolacea]MCP2347585.1 hypothetical protein [Nonomuraea roseoviolacea subsp. carminata]
MDRLKRLRPAAAALLLLIAFGCSPAFALRYPSNAASSAEEIAERLRANFDEAYRRDPSLELLAPCRTETGTEARLPPQGVPAYAAELRVAELPGRLSARFWVTSPAKASVLLDASMRAADQCTRQPEGVVTGFGDLDETGSTLLDFAAPGWRAVQVLVTEPGSSDAGDVGTTATVVAVRGTLLAEVQWYWSIKQGTRSDPHWVGQGNQAARSVLAAIGGVPTRPAP